MFAQFLLGFILGLRHSADADHVVAVSGLLTQVTGDGPAKHKRFLAARIGALWGLGHLLAVFVAGCAVIALQSRFPAWLAWSLEILVAAVLVALGVNAIRKSLAGHYHFHFHRHGGPQHAHVHFHPTKKPHDAHAHDAHLAASLAAHPHWKGPLSLGLLHGLAGTASLALLVLATIPSPWVGVAYLLTFGFGALLGMAVLSTVLSLGLGNSTRTRWFRSVRLAAGTVSAAFGAFLIYQALAPAALPF